MPRKPSSPTDHLRAICLKPPEATEQEAWGDPTWRVRDKIFAMEQRGDGRILLWCKAPPGSQAVLIGADPDPFFKPAYVGSKGWIGMRLDRRPDWVEDEKIVSRADSAEVPAEAGGACPVLAIAPRS